MKKTDLKILIQALQKEYDKGYKEAKISGTLMVNESVIISTEKQF